MGREKHEVRLHVFFLRNCSKLVHFIGIWKLAAKAFHARHTPHLLLKVDITKAFDTDLEFVQGIIFVFGSTFALHTNFAKCSITPICRSAEDMELVQSYFPALSLTFLSPTSASRYRSASYRKRPCNPSLTRSPTSFLPGRVNSPLWAAALC
uniref:Reverse transcriptase domain-containing protein n=2 Tax=Oryza sativa subsp. japonica TaxID=39947 RepID=Q6AST0_ORYSJ|nr:hypothetical protein [Oryza sativa Japonica Group]ABF97827.1 hypothetical protein LOC_Os03g43920 [Oryza sativa Japonica Group]